MRSLNVKFALFFLVALFCSVVISFAITRNILIQNLQDDIQDDLEVITLFMSDSPTIEQAVVNANQLTNYNITIVSKQEAFEQLSVNNQKKLLMGQPIVDINKHLMLQGYVYVDEQILHFEMKKNTTNNLLMDALVLIMKLTLVLGLVFIFIGVYFMTRPIKQLTKATESIANGDFEVKLPPVSKDEVGQLSNSFQSMVQSVQQMLQVQRDFISNVSHEYQTPITSIKGFAKALREKNFTKQQQQTYLTIIEEEAERLSNLSANVLKLSHLQSESQQLLEKRPFSLDRMLKETITLLYPQANKKEIEWDVDIDEVMIHADESLFKQIWINLLSNAIHYSPIQGMISIRCTKSNGNIEVCIIDEGPGIDEEKIGHVFEPFYKSVDSIGNGLGLSIVQAIVEQHKGIIQLTNVQPHGLQVRIIFHSPNSNEDDRNKNGLENVLNK